MVHTFAARNDEFEFKKKELEEDAIIIEQEGRHKYSEAYKELTKDYYLSF